MNPPRTPCGGDGAEAWTGITCNTAGKVTEIKIQYTYLAGSVPALGYVLPPTLEKLELTKNYINGTIPASWRLPPGLKVLDLRRNSLSGSIPAIRVLSARHH